MHDGAAAGGTVRPAAGPSHANPPTMIARPLRLILATTTAAVGTDTMLAALTPARFSEWAQAVVGAAFLAASTVIIVWERKQAAIQKYQHAATTEALDSISGKLDQAKITELDTGLKASQQDRAKLHEQMEQLSQQLQEIGQRTSKLVCPLAHEDGTRPCEVNP